LLLLCNFKRHGANTFLISYRNSSTLATPGASMAALVMFLLLLVVSFLYIRKRRQYKMTSSSRLLKYTISGGTPRSRGSTNIRQRRQPADAPLLLRGAGGSNRRL
jgi:hypothetical protein